MMPEGPVYFFTSGYSYLSGCVLLTAGVFLSFFYSRRIPKILSLAAMGSALLMMLFSGVPPGPFFRFIVILAVGLFLALQLGQKLIRGFSVFLQVGLVILAGYAFFSEYSAMQMPYLGGPYHKFYVISQNSALAQALHRKMPRTQIVNLSDERLTAATAETAIAETGSPKENTAVLIDLPPGERIRANEYKFFLLRLLREAAKKNKLVLLPEFRGVPSMIRYLSVQKEAAKRFGAILIPRKYAGLSPEAMAELIQNNMAAP